MPTVMKEYQTLVFFKSELEDTKKHVEEKDSKNTNGLKLDTLVACADVVKWN